jgi:hypothetical protein
VTPGDAPPSPPTPTVRWFRRVLAREVPGYEAAGWVRVARDWSASVGELALMEWSGHGALPATEDQ